MTFKSPKLDAWNKAQTEIARLMARGLKPTFALNNYPRERKTAIACARALRALGHIAKSAATRQTGGGMSFVSYDCWTTEEGVDALDSIEEMAKRENKNLFEMACFVAKRPDEFRIRDAKARLGG
jgi:hypothetical protein